MVAKVFPAANEMDTQQIWEGNPEQFVHTRGKELRLALYRIQTPSKNLRRVKKVSKESGKVSFSPPTKNLDGGLRGAELPPPTTFERHKGEKEVVKCAELKRVGGSANGLGNCGDLPV